MSLMSKITRFARSPQGKRAFSQAKRYASDPATKQKIAQARRRFAKR
jgi:hypothetical protein